MVVDKGLVLYSGKVYKVGKKTAFGSGEVLGLGVSVVTGSNPARSLNYFFLSNFR